MITPEAARRHLEALAGEPRPAGGEAERRARGYCARVLREAGMEVSEETFEYSAFPGLWATPIFGVFAVISLLTALAAARIGRPGLGLGVLASAALMMAIGGFWLARHGVSRLAFMRRSGLNLVGRRGHAEPPLWLMAHLDSKSQPVPMLLRAGGITLMGLTWLAGLALLAGQMAGSVGTAWLPWIAALGVASGVPIALSLVGARSPGAVDDASGVAAVLLAAAEAADAPLGVVLTSAEELGLAGARGWVRMRPTAAALNCDGVDDAGAYAAMYSGQRPTRLLAAFERAAAELGLAARTHRVLPGVLVDGVALADAGWEVITISRGTVHTLRRIHTPADSISRMSGTGIPDAARVMVSIARELGR